MRWYSREVRPSAHYLAQREARREPRQIARTWPPRRFDTRKCADPGELRSHAIWLAAPLTTAARAAFEKCHSALWEVSEPGNDTAFALIVRPDRRRHPRGSHGGIVVTHAHRTVAMSKTDSTLVVTSDAAFTCGGSSSAEGLRLLCHYLEGSSPGGEPERDFWGRPSLRLEIPAEDIDLIEKLVSRR